MHICDTSMVRVTWRAVYRQLDSDQQPHPLGQRVAARSDRGADGEHRDGHQLEQVLVLRDEREGSAVLVVHAVDVSVEQRPSVVAEVPCVKGRVKRGEAEQQMPNEGAEGRRRAREEVAAVTISEAE